MGPPRALRCLGLLLLALVATQHARASYGGHRADELAMLKSRATASQLAHESERGYEERPPVEEELLGAQYGAQEEQAKEQGQAAAAAVSRAALPAALPGKPQVLAKPIQVVLIFYGTAAEDWPEASKQLVRQLLRAVPDASQGDEPATVHNWWNLARLYADQEGNHVSGFVNKKLEIGVTTPSRILNMDLINSMIMDLFDLKRLPKIPDAVYAFLTARGIIVEGPGACGFHHAAAVKFFWAGVPHESSSCGPSLPESFKYPQASKAQTAFVAEFARQLVHTATDPYSLASASATDGCSERPYGNVFSNADSVAYNHVGPDGTLYLLPAIQNPVSKSCAGELAVLPGVCGDKAFGLPCDLLSGPQRELEGSAYSEVARAGVAEEPQFEATGRPLSQGGAAAAVSAVAAVSNPLPLARVSVTPGREATSQLTQLLEGVSMPQGPFTATTVGKPLHVAAEGVSAVGKPLEVENPTAKAVVDFGVSAVGHPLEAPQTEGGVSAVGNPLTVEGDVSAVGKPLEVEIPSAKAAVIDFGMSAVGHPLEVPQAEGGVSAVGKPLTVEGGVSAVGKPLEVQVPTAKAAVINFGVSAVGHPLEVPQTEGGVSAVGKPLTVEGGVSAMGKPLEVQVPSAKAAVINSGVSAVGHPLENLSGQGVSAVGEPLQVENPVSRAVESGSGVSAVGQPLQVQSEVVYAVGKPLTVDGPPVPPLKAATGVSAVGKPLQVVPDAGVVSVEQGADNFPEQGTNKLDAVDVQIQDAYVGSSANLKWAQDNAGR